MAKTLCMGVSVMTLLAPKDAARRLNLSTSRLAQLDRAGSLPAVRDSMGRRLFDASVVEGFAVLRETRRAAAVTQTEAVTVA